MGFSYPSYMHEISPTAPGTIIVTSYKLQTGRQRLYCKLKDMFVGL